MSVPAMVSVIVGLALVGIGLAIRCHQSVTMFRLFRSSRRWRADGKAPWAYNGDPYGLAYLCGGPIHMTATAIFKMQAAGMMELSMTRLSKTYALSCTVDYNRLKAEGSALEAEIADSLQRSIEILNSGSISYEDFHDVRVGYPESRVDYTLPTPLAISLIAAAATTASLQTIGEVEQRLECSCMLISRKTVDRLAWYGQKFRYLAALLIYAELVWTLLTTKAVDHIIRAIPVGVPSHLFRISVHVLIIFVALSVLWFLGQRLIVRICRVVAPWPCIKDRRTDVARQYVRVKLPPDALLSDRFALSGIADLVASDQPCWTQPGVSAPRAGGLEWDEVNALEHEVLKMRLPSVGKWLGLPGRLVD